MTIILGIAPAAAEDEVIVRGFDTGGHTALIRGLTFTPDGNYIVSAGEDKVIRIWDWRKAKTVRTISLRSNSADSGRIYAIAISPDGRYLAVGGWVGPFTGKLPSEEEQAHHVLLIDFATGKVLARLKGHRNVVNSLAFSPNSKLLASGGGVGDDTAIIWDLEHRRELFKLKGHTGEIFGLSFSYDNQRVVTASYDNSLSLWRIAGGALIRKMTGHRNKVQSAVFVPSDGSIISGDWNGEMRQWDGQTGEFRRIFAKQPSHIGSLAVTPDGRYLLSTCGYSGCNYVQHVWDIANSTEAQSYKAHNSIVLASSFSPDGNLVATAGGDHFPINVWDFRTGKTLSTMSGAGEPIWAVGFSKDGQRIGWGHRVQHGWTTNKYGVIEHSMLLPTDPNTSNAPQDAGAPENWMRGIETVGSYSLRVRKGGAYGFDAILDVLKDGKVATSIELGPTNGYQHRSYSFTPDGKTIISGAGNGALAAYSLDGKRIGQFVGHEGDIWGVVPSPDGKYLLSGANDLTVRLWNLKTRELIVTLFHASDDAWVMWTPQGFYAGSPGADSFFNWEIRRDGFSEPIQPAQLRKKLNRPDIVARAIALASAEAAVKEATGADFKIADLLNQPVPKLKITPMPANFVASGGSAKIEVEVGATPNPVKAIRIQVNGRQVAEDAPEKGGIPKGKRSYTIPLARGENTVAVIALNDIGETIERVQVSHEGEGLLDSRGTLYILAIGVTKYPKLSGNNLYYASDDAKAFAEAMQKAAGPLHKKVVKRVLANDAGGDDEPTTANIIDALDTLRKAAENDTVVLFLAGHGINRGLNYYFVPTDAKWTAEGEIRASTMVPWQLFQSAVESAKGVRIMFLDTCHSANAYNPRALNESVNANILVYSATRWDQLSNETNVLDPELRSGHGLFALALTEGIRGKAKTPAGEVRAIPLRDFLRAQVAAYIDEANKKIEALNQQIANPGKKLAPLTPQEPQFFKGRDAEDYLLAIAN